MSFKPGDMSDSDEPITEPVANEPIPVHPYDLDHEDDA